MIAVLVRRLALATAAAMIALPGASSQALAGEIRTSAEDEPLQVIADIVLIEAQCRQLNVDYGKLFAYAEANGIRPVEVLPTGDRRAAFDLATRRRLKETPVERLCSGLAAERDAVIPGVFLAR